MQPHQSFRPDRTRAFAVLALATLSLCGCGGIDLDPTTHHQVAKAPTVLTNPPQELRDGSAREEGQPNR